MGGDRDSDDLPGRDELDRAHDLDNRYVLDNFYVLDTSFLPSIGAVSPPPAAIANALRIGDRLAGRLR